MRINGPNINLRANELLVGGTVGVIMFFLSTAKTALLNSTRSLAVMIVFVYGKSLYTTFTYLPTPRKLSYPIPTTWILGNTPSSWVPCKIRVVPFLNGCSSLVFKQMPSIKINTASPLANKFFEATNAYSFRFKNSLPSRKR